MGITVLKRKNSVTMYSKIDVGEYFVFKDDFDGNTVESVYRKAKYGLGEENCLVIEHDEIRLTGFKVDIEVALVDLDSIQVKIKEK